MHAHLISILLGLLWPAYCTYKTLKSGKSDAYDLALTKWIVIAFFASACYAADLFVSWLPFYQDLKVIGLLALTLLREERALKPWIAKNESSIDSLILSGQSIYRAKSRELIKWMQTRAITYMSEQSKNAPKRPSSARPAAAK